MAKRSGAKKVKKISRKSKASPKRKIIRRRAVSRRVKSRCARPGACRPRYNSRQGGNFGKSFVKGFTAPFKAIGSAAKAIAPILPFAALL